MWCVKMIEEDEREKIETLRNLLEYQIAFVPEANPNVIKAIEERSGKGIYKSSKEEFAKTIKDVFGHDLDEIRFIPEGK